MSNQPWWHHPHPFRVHTPPGSTHSPLRRFLDHTGMGEGMRHHRDALVREALAKAAKWDRYFMGFAEHAATASKDTTKVGAALVNPEGAVILTAYNGPPKGVRDTPERTCIRPSKYLYIAHAERNLISFAARSGIRTAGCRVYCTHACCAVCAQTMIQAGIVEVVYGPGVFIGMEEQVAAAREMISDVGGTIRPIFVCEEVKS